MKSKKITFCFADHDSLLLVRVPVITSDYRSGYCVAAYNLLKHFPEYHRFEPYKVHKGYPPGYTVVTIG